MFLLIFPYFFLVHFEGLKGRGPCFSKNKVLRMTQLLFSGLRQKKKILKSQ